MNKYTKVEKLLSNYKMYKISIENMEQDIKYLKEEDGVKGIGFDNISTSPTNKTSDVVADTVMSKMEKIHYLEHRIEGNKRKIDNIDKTMEGLTDIQRQIVKDRYFKGKQWYIVAYNSNCSESTAKRERKKAIDSLVIGIYGKED